VKRLTSLLLCLTYLLFACASNELGLANQESIKRKEHQSLPEQAQSIEDKVHLSMTKAEIQKKIGENFVNYKPGEFEQEQWETWEYNYEEGKIRVFEDPEYEQKLGNPALKYGLIDTQLFLRWTPQNDMKSYLIRWMEDDFLHEFFVSSEGIKTKKKRVFGEKK